MPFFTCFFVSPPFVIFGFLDSGIVVCWREKEEKKKLSQRTSFLSFFSENVCQTNVNLTLLLNCWQKESWQRLNRKDGDSGESPENVSCLWAANIAGVWIWIWSDSGVSGLGSGQRAWNLYEALRSCHFSLFCDVFPTFVIVDFLDLAVLKCFFIFSITACGTDFNSFFDPFSALPCFFLLLGEQACRVGFDGTLN